TPSMVNSLPRAIMRAPGKASSTSRRFSLRGPTRRAIRWLGTVTVLEVDTELQPTRLPLGPVRHGTAVGPHTVVRLPSGFAPEPDPTENLLGELRRWAADQEVAHLARSRSRARWLRQQAAESATLAGLLLDLAERRATVTIDAAGWAHTGRVRAVSTGLCLL